MKYLHIYFLSIALLISFDLSASKYDKESASDLYKKATKQLKEEDYKLTGTLNQNLARIGLMVAPLCMKYLADNIYENILKPYGEVK